MTEKFVDLLNMLSDTDADPISYSEVVSLVGETLAEIPNHTQDIAAQANLYKEVLARGASRIGDALQPLNNDESVASIHRDYINGIATILAAEIRARGSQV